LQNHTQEALNQKTLKVFEGVKGGSFFPKSSPCKKIPFSKVFEEGYGEKPFFKKFLPVVI
jgi:hypothetical protein